MPGPVSERSKGPGPNTPYVPSWCYPAGPKDCPCGHMEDKIMTAETFVRKTADSKEGTMTTPSSCGPFYRAAKDYYTGGDLEKERLFAAGFVHGQAEKVYIGACRAAMFRPSTPEKQAMVHGIAHVAAVMYGLVVLTIQKEIWICKPEDEGNVEELQEMTVDSIYWHRYRGHLCGVPLEEIDEHFHLRRGAREAAD